MNRQSKTETVYFMEGPCAVEISSLENETIGFSLLNGHTRDIQIEAAVSTFLFAKSLAIQCHEVLLVYKKNNWWSKDADFFGIESNHPKSCSSRVKPQMKAGYKLMLY